MKPSSFDAVAWRKKAGAFVIRCHHHLFGKNNGDPLAYLFTRGIKNEFAKKMLLGWNKFSQERPGENWGFGPGPEKMVLQKGLVIPYIVEKELKSVFIYSYEEAGPKNTSMVPGSACTCMILENEPGQAGKIPPVLVHDLMQGLLLFQEKKETGCIIIHPDPETPKDETVKLILESSEKKPL
jgi:hypothetical protein